jgi:hypothetical protein
VYTKNTGLIEVVGFGFGMYLKVFEQNNAIVFKSTRFFADRKYKNYYSSAFNNGYHDG